MKHRVIPAAARRLHHCLAATTGLGIFLGLCDGSRATVIAADDFRYPDGNIAGTGGGSGWSGTWTAAQGTPTIFQERVNINSSSGQQAERLLPRQGADGTRVWLRFTGQQSTNGTGPNLTYGGLGLHDGNTERALIGKWWPGNYVWSVAGAMSRQSTLVPTSVYVRLTYGTAGSNDTLDVWFNPALTGSETDLGPPALTTSAADLSFDRVRLRGGTGVAVTEQWRFQNLILADTFESLAGFPAPLAHESFSGHAEGPLVGQTQRGTGLAPVPWAGTAADASTVTADGGLGGFVVSSGGKAKVKGDGSRTTGFLDLATGSAVRTAGLFDTASGTVGGGAVNGTLYASFMFRALANDRTNESGGLQLMRGNSPATGLLVGNGPGAWAYSIFNPANSTSVDLRRNGGTGDFAVMDNGTRLFVAKITYRAGVADDCTVWMDPDPEATGAEQPPAVYSGKLTGDFSFDRFALCGGDTARPFEFDEIRFGTTWSSVLPTVAPLRLANEGIDVKINPDGSIRTMAVRRGSAWETVAFRSDQFRGPAWRITDTGSARSVPLSLADASQALYQGADGNLRLELKYALADARLVATARITNAGTQAWSPVRAGILMGLDTYMESYPSWNELYFPTLLRCEKTHFWGYAMTPRGRILGVASPDPVASWHQEYEGNLHRIFTFGMDFLNAPPLPARHPQNLATLQPGETRAWTVVLGDVPNEDSVNLDGVLPVLSDMADAPMVQADRHTGEPGEEVKLTFWGNPVEAHLKTPEGATLALDLTAGTGGTMETVVTLPESFGLCTIVATDAGGRLAEASVNVRHPWSWYLKQARANAISKPQKDAGAQCEGYYGLYSMFLAKRWFPDAGLDAASDAKFNEIYPLMFDSTTGYPTRNEWRIQNSSTMAGILADRYLAGGTLTNMNHAATLCDFLVSRQGGDGAYYAHGTNYTSVIYPGKSIMEVMEVERELGKTSPAWQNRYTSHHNSVRRAMDHLALNLDNIGTEGQATFEDGMISCSATQLGMFALSEENPVERRKYADAAAFFASAHRCLDQLVTPDGRQNGGTLRFWESQYDIIARPNMMCSPHGWTAWNIYSRWYLYQLTGNVDYLRQAMNALGSCSQVIHPSSGELRWAFISDPYVQATLFVENPANTNQQTQGSFVQQVVGEQHLPMVSGWCRAPYATSVSLYSGHDGGCNDNDVHEIFKCLEEVALTSAYVVVNEDGSVETWNCQASQESDTLQVTPSESIVARIHVNAARPTRVAMNFNGNRVTRTLDGTSWQEVPVDGEAYHQWRTSHFGTDYAERADTGDSADFDRDDLPNWLEFVLGTDPAAATSLPPPVTVKLEGEDYLQWEIPLNAAAAPHEPRIEISQDLEQWNIPGNAPDRSVIVDHGATSRRVQLRLSAFPKHFFRAAADFAE